MTEIMIFKYLIGALILIAFYDQANVIKKGDEEIFK